MLAGVDLDPNVLGMNGYEVQKKLFDMGLHVKTTGNCAILSPPFISERDQIDFMVATVRELLARRH
jgi:beta-alanine--pyruvate transaminase